MSKATSKGVAHRNWPSLTAGGLLGLFVFSTVGLGESGWAWVAAAFGAFFAYLFDCVFYRKIFCPKSPEIFGIPLWGCGGENFIISDRGVVADKPCWRCKRQRLYYRPGARLLGLDKRS
jgi:hypothetical protein